MDCDTRMLDSPEWVGHGKTIAIHDIPDRLIHIPKIKSTSMDIIKPQKSHTREVQYKYCYEQIENSRGIKLCIYFFHSGRNEFIYGAVYMRNPI